MTQAWITKCLPVDSPGTLVLVVESSSRNLKGFTRVWALNESGVGKICSLQPISHRTLEAVQYSSVKAKMLSKKQYFFRISSGLYQQQLYAVCKSQLHTSIRNSNVKHILELS